MAAKVSDRALVEGVLARRLERASEEMPLLRHEGEDDLLVAVLEEVLHAVIGDEEGRPGAPRLGPEGDRVADDALGDRLREPAAPAARVPLERPGLVHPVREHEREALVAARSVLDDADRALVHEREGAREDLAELVPVEGRVAHVSPPADVEERVQPVDPWLAHERHGAVAGLHGSNDARLEELPDPLDPGAGSLVGPPGVGSREAGALEPARVLGRVPRLEEERRALEPRDEEAVETVSAAVHGAHDARQAARAEPGRPGVDERSRGRLVRGLEVAELTERESRVDESRDPPLVAVEEELLREPRRRELELLHLAERRHPERVVRPE